MLSRHVFAYRRPLSATAAAMNKTVLLVDGDENSLVVYHAILVHAGYEVELAVDGEAGFELAHSCKPDVLVTALAITKLSGLKRTGSRRCARVAICSSISRSSRSGCWNLSGS